MKTILLIVAAMGLQTASGETYEIYKLTRSDGPKDDDPEPLLSSKEDIRGSYVRFGTLWVGNNKPQEGVEVHKDHWINLIDEEGDETNVLVQLDLAGYNGPGGQGYKAGLGISHLESHIRARVELENLNDDGQGDSFHGGFYASLGYVNFVPEEENEYDFSEFHAGLLITQMDSIDPSLEQFAGLDVGAMKSFNEGALVLSALIQGGILTVHQDTYSDRPTAVHPNMAKVVLKADWNPFSIVSVGGEFAIVRQGGGPGYGYGKVGVGVGF